MIRKMLFTWVIIAATLLLLVGCDAGAPAIKPMATSLQPQSSPRASNVPISDTRILYRYEGRPHGDKKEMVIGPSGKARLTNRDVSMGRIQLTPDRQAHLMKLFDDAHFFNLQDKYPESGVAGDDGISRTIALTQGDLTKTITIKQVSKQDIPQSLLDLITELDNIISDVEASTNTPTSSTASPSMGSHTPTVAGSIPNIKGNVQFIDMMVPHHQLAIDMAQLALDHAQHGELKGLARDIIREQKDEINRMLIWRTDIAGPTPSALPSMSGMSGQGQQMPGMDVDLKQLAASPNFDQNFIQAMIPHHQSAIDMSQSALPNLKHIPLHDLANDIITTQQVEIDRMRGWQKAWK